MVVPKRLSHFVFSIIQSGLTCLVATAIASRHVIGFDAFVASWLVSWVSSWLTMLPVVLLVAPLIRKAVDSICAAN